MGIAENAEIEGWMGRETPEVVLEPNLPIIDPASSSLGFAA